MILILKKCDNNGENMIISFIQIEWKEAVYFSILRWKHREKLNFGHESQSTPYFMECVFSAIFGWFCVSINDEVLFLSSESYNHKSKTFGYRFQRCTVLFFSSFSVLSLFGFAPLVDMKKPHFGWVRENNMNDIINGDDFIFQRVFESLPVVLLCGEMIEMNIDTRTTDETLSKSPPNTTHTHCNYLVKGLWQACHPVLPLAAFTFLLIDFVSFILWWFCDCANKCAMFRWKWVFSCMCIFSETVPQRQQKLLLMAGWLVGWLAKC